MSKLKEQILKLPEIYFIIICLLATYKPPFTFNWLFLALASVMVLQVKFQSVKLGLFMAVTALFLNLIMLGALISELSEFATINAAAMQLLIGGSLAWLLSMFFTAVLFYKNVDIKTLA